jgi:hypothetical protein
VVLADPSQKQYAAQNLSEGAMDYVLKGFMDARTLDRVLRHALARNTFEGLADLPRDSMTGFCVWCKRRSIARSSVTSSAGVGDPGCDHAEARRRGCRGETSRAVPPNADFVH